MPLLPSVGNHFHESACRGDKLHQTGEELGQVTNGSPDPKQRSWAQVGGFMYHFARAEDQPGRHQAHGTRRKVRSCCRTHRLREEGRPRAKVRVRTNNREREGQRVRERRVQQSLHNEPVPEDRRTRVFRAYR